MGPWGYAYAITIGTTGRYKLGHTDDPGERLATFRTISTEPLDYYMLIESDDCSAIEKVMKDYLEAYRVPGLEGREIFEPPRAKLDEAIAVAEEWNEAALPDIAAARVVEGQPCDPDLELEPTDEHWALYRELLRLRQIERRAQQGQKRIATRSQLAMGQASSLKLVATWKSEYRPQFDKAGFVKQHPHLAPLVDEFTTVKHSRRWLPRW